MTSSSLQYANEWILKEVHHNFKLALISGAQAPIIIHYEYKKICNVIVAI